MSSRAATLRSEPNVFYDVETFAISHRLCVPREDLDEKCTGQASHVVGSSLLISTCSRRQVGEMRMLVWIVDRHIRIYCVPHLLLKDHLSRLPVIFTIMFLFRHRVSRFTIDTFLVCRHLRSTNIIIIFIRSDILTSDLLLLQLPILPARLLRRTRLLRLGAIRLNRTPAPIPLLQRIQLLREDIARELAILLATARLLALDHDARGEVAELDGTGGLVDLLTPRACAFEEFLFDLGVRDLGAWGQCFVVLAGGAGEGAAWAAADRCQEASGGRPCRVGCWGAEETWEHWQ